MAWLRENLIEKPVNSVAVASIHGAGGMSKTFLAHVFAAEHPGEIPFLEIHTGGALALGSEDRAAGKSRRGRLDTAARIHETACAHHNPLEGSGGKSHSQGAPLGSLRPPESMALFRNVLKKDFVPAWKEDYQNLADYLTHRPTESASRPSP